MRFLILSDIHGNLHALEAVLADARQLGFDHALVLGDLVGYGANPGEVIDRTLSLTPATIIRGNHDKVCAGLSSSRDFNEVARDSVEWTAAQLTPPQMAALKALPKGPAGVTGEIEICHGSPFHEDYYIFDEDDVRRAMLASTRRICFFGHTHLPGLFAFGNVVESGEEAGAYHLPADGQILINVGSVGQPRDGDWRAAYGVLDDETRVLRLRRVEYDIAGAQARIRRAHLPEWLALRLERGQ